MGVFDQGAKYTIKDEPADFFAWRLPRFFAAFAFAGWSDTTTLAFPGEPDRVCDTVAEFASRSGAGPRVLLDVESEAEPDYDMLERMGEYGFRLRREKRYGPGQAGKYAVAGLLLNLTGPEQPATLDTRQVDLDGAGIFVSVVVATLRNEDARAALRRVELGEWPRCVLPWIPLMDGGADVAIIQEWVRLALAEPNERRRADYGGLALVFAELAGCWAVWKKELEGWGMKQSQQVFEWQNEARQEADVARLRKVILRALELRMRTSVPGDLATALTELNDVDELMRWFEASQTTDTLDAFRAAVGQPASPAT